VTFELLPRAYLTWDASAEDPDEWQYWSVYRQRLGDSSTLIRLAVIRQMDILFYEDYTVESGVTYQWFLSQTIDNGSDLVESDLAGPAQAVVVCDSIFLHDVEAPQYYVEIAASALQERNPRAVSFLRARAAEAEVGFAGPFKGQIVDLQWRDAWEDDDVYAAALVLLERMVDEGAVMMLRHELVPGMFCVFQENGLGRTAAPVLHGPVVSLRKVRHEEAV